MSFGAGDARKRPGFMDSFRAALTPAPLPPDDGKPLVRPNNVTIATVLAIAAGAVFVLIGGFSIVTTDDQLNQAIAQYNANISDCTNQFGGIGDAVVVPTGASSDVTNQAEACKTYIPLTPEAISGARTQNIMISAIVVVVGLIALAAGWFVRSGNRWGRTGLVVAVLLSVVLSMMFQVSNLFTLGASLMLIVAVMLCFIGKGGVFFARVKARRAG
ncbi:MAG TPA: hypothetical protein VIU11_28240 [Nakamurella sp.]